jgi:DNA-binding NarL/FixJ family response regulator
LEQSTTRLEHAKALCELGTAIRLERKPSDARDPLYKALELANVCGAGALEERVRSELGATGARPRREALGGVGSLTPSEKRVADLAADGLSNREIAQELYVTPKTVEVHLSNTYRKLEIRSRRQLSGALAA